MTQGTQMSALGQPGGIGWGGRWEALAGWRRYMSAYGRFIMMLGKIIIIIINHNIIKYLSSN